VSERGVTVDEAAARLQGALDAALAGVRAEGFKVAGLLRVWREDDAGEETAGATVAPGDRPPDAPPLAATGNACRDCGGALRQSGACEVCTNCGSTTGCG